MPSLLHPSTLTWEQLKAEIGWPAGGIRDFFSPHVFGTTILYYLFSLVLWRFLPAQEVCGTKLKKHGRPLNYRFNGESSPTVGP